MIVDVAVILHDPAPCGTDKLGPRFGNHTTVSGSCAEPVYVDPQLGQIQNRPGRRLYTFGQVDGLIEKFSQKYGFIRPHFANLYTNFPHQSIPLIGCRMTVFSFSGLQRRTSLRYIS